MINKKNLIQRAINRIAKTKDGETVFRHIMGLCGYNLSDVVLTSTNDVNIQATLNNTYRRTVYLDLRALIEPEYLKKIEFEEEEENKNV